MRIAAAAIAATVPFFAAKVMLDYPQVKLYKGSQLDWLRDDRGLPFWTYDAPSQLREMASVNSWNNPMLRMFGATRMSIIDVRPAAAFKQSPRAVRDQRAPPKSSGAISPRRRSSRKSWGLRESTSITRR